MLNSIDSVYRNPVPLLYQSGYLTIKGYDERFRMYKLGFPNQEVENGFVRYLLPYYAPKERGESEFFIQKFIQEVERGDAEAFMERLQTMFVDNSYQVMGKMELYFQNTMYVIFKMMGFLYRSGAHHPSWTHRHRHQNIGLHLCDGNQTRWQCRRGFATDS